MAIADVNAWATTAHWQGAVRFVDFSDGVTSSGDFYGLTQEDGTIHISTELLQMPQRNQVQEIADVIAHEGVHVYDLTNNYRCAPVARGLVGSLMGSECTLDTQPTWRCWETETRAWNAQVEYWNAVAGLRISQSDRFSTYMQGLSQARPGKWWSVADLDTLIPSYEQECGAAGNVKHWDMVPFN